MSVFEHLMTLGSFILALGLTTVLMFVATLVHHRNEARLSWPHALWTSSIFINQINFWLGSYVFHHLTRTDYPTIAFVVVFPIVLYLQSALVVTDAETALDLPAHHARNKRAYLGLVLISTLMDGAYFLYVASTTPGFDPRFYLAADAIFVTTALAGIFDNRRAVQIAAPAIHLALRTLGFFLSAQPLLIGG